jgi:transcriptional regulator with XRE-family HTH domain
MNGDQLRMARALLRLTVRELAELAGADKMAIVRMEAGRKPHASTAAKLKEALEARGIVFIGAMDPFHEPTVAMRFGMKPPAPSEEEEEGADDPTLSPKGREALRDYWADGERWGRLVEDSRKALTRALD